MGSCSCALAHEEEGQGRLASTVLIQGSWVLYLLRHPQSVCSHPSPNISDDIVESGRAASLYDPSQPCFISRVEAKADSHRLSCQTSQDARAEGAGLAWHASRITRLVEFRHVAVGIVRPQRPADAGLCQALFNAIISVVRVRTASQLGHVIASTPDTIRHTHGTRARASTIERR